MEIALLHQLKLIDCAIFERRKDKLFTLKHDSSDWLLQLVNNAPVDTLDLGSYSHF